MNLHRFCGLLGNCISFVTFLQEIDEPALIPHIAEASSIKYPYELLFRSLQKLLMDTATSEYSKSSLSCYYHHNIKSLLLCILTLFSFVCRYNFCDDFFGEESIFYEIFSGIFFWSVLIIVGSFHT